MPSIAFIGIIGFFIILYSHAAPINDTSNPDLTKLEQSYGLFEGDMMFPMTARGVVKRGNSVRWPGGIVPYVISSNYGSQEQATIVSAMRRLESLVAVSNRQCILFRPRSSTDQYYISIENRDGCWSYVGYNEGMQMPQILSLKRPGCIYEGIIMHEFLHVLGFFHEQSRPDRDSYVRVNFANIQSGMEDNFQKDDNNSTNTQSTRYDYGSIMHYTRTEFSRNGLPTIEPLQSGTVMGQRRTLSAIDILEVRLFYDCIGTVSILPPTTQSPSSITSRISMRLTSTSPIFIRPKASTGNFYYAVIQATVVTNGTYILQSSSTIDTFGCIYNNIFYPSNPSSNLMMTDDDGADNSQFKFTISLQSGVTYTLVATTYAERTIGDLTIIATGSGTISFTGTSIVSIPAPIIYTSRYSDELMLISPRFNRPGGSSSNYFYQAIRMTVTQTGSYTFSSSSRLYTYGIIYINYFSPFQPTENVFAQNNDGADNHQFSIELRLTSGLRYVLVFTTYYTNIIGSFSITGTGPGQVSFTRLTN